MNFIAPLNLAFALLSGAIVVLYLLRLKRKERMVSSTLLWQESLRDVQANAPWQKLRQSLLMWLQILVVILAALALARPAISVWTAGGQTIVIVMDASASMAATDVAPSRFGQAQREAARLVGALSGGDEAAVISAGSSTRVLAPLTRDKNALQRAINNAKPLDTSANLGEAIALASSLLRDRKPSQITVLSDGASPVETAEKATNVQFVKIGLRSDNVAITAMDARRGYADGARAQVFVTARNFSNRAREVNLELSRDGELFAVRPLAVPANSARSELFEGAFASGLFTARLDVKDDLASDNTTYASLEAATKSTVLLISEGNVFLEKALSLDKNVELVRVAPGESLPQGRFDVVVSDGDAGKVLPDTNLLLFNTIPTSAPVEKANGLLATPGVADWNRTHPVTRNASWADLRVAESLNARTKPWAQAIVEAERAPLVVAGERGGRRVVWCGFDVRASDLPLRVTFPIFITNALRWLGSSRGAARESATQRTGEAVSLALPAGTGEAEVSAPDGSKRRVRVDGTTAMYDGATQAGLYRVAAGKYSSAFGVSLLNATESDLTPKDKLTIGGKELGGTSSARSNRELWPWIVFAALSLLGLEWWIFHRGV
ncbi:MAG TPA: BatA and WFA domain-containing protein [Abditibacteriaceae bacterium]|jgi:hypothetical protein